MQHMVNAMPCVLSPTVTHFLTAAQSWRQNSSHGVRAVSDLVVQMVQESNRQQHPVEVGVLLQGDVNASLQLGPLKDEGSWHADEA